jgi:hypothetical protein
VTPDAAGQGFQHDTFLHSLNLGLFLESLVSGMPPSAGAVQGRFERIDHPGEVAIDQPHTIFFRRLIIHHR